MFDEKVVGDHIRRRALPEDLEGIFNRRGNRYKAGEKKITVREMIDNDLDMGLLHLIEAHTTTVVLQ